MNLQDLPAVMTVDAASGFLRISRLAAEEGLRSGDLPSVDIDGVCAVDTQQLLLEMGVNLTELERQDSEAPA